MLYQFPSSEIIITGLLNLSFNLAATIPITPSCQLDHLKLKLDHLNNFSFI